jgi:DNA-binding transcriptional MerR regulator
MKWTIPGTVLPADAATMQNIDEKFSAMFLGGGMVLSQVAAVTGLEPYTIQNWVKRGFLTKPVGKKYTLRQLCRIININMLKAALPMEEICRLISYINGHLDDESDDLIDDSRLYFLFIRLASYHRQMNNAEGRDALLAEVMKDYQEPVPGAKERVEQVLKVMLTAWAASLLRQQACNMAAELKTGENI